jgi:hypothetical protein
LRVFSPDPGCELVLRNTQWLHKITATQIDLDLLASRGKQNLGEGPDPVAPLLQHKVCGADVVRVIWGLTDSDDERLRTANNITNSVDLLSMSTILGVGPGQACKNSQPNKLSLQRFAQLHPPFGARP